MSIYFYAHGADGLHRFIPWHRNHVDDRLQALKVKLDFLDSGKGGISSAHLNLYNLFQATAKESQELSAHIQVVVEVLIGLFLS